MESWLDGWLTRPGWVQWDALAGLGDGQLDHAALRQASDLVDFLVDEYTKSINGMPRMQRALASVAQGRCDAQVLRSLWTCSYWHQRELKDCWNWGFSAPSG